MTAARAPTGSSARRSGASHADSPASDYGPAERLARGEVVVEDAADPADPRRTIRRARVRCDYDRWWRRGWITDAEREAADRVAIGQELLSGAVPPTLGLGARQAYTAQAVAERRVQAAADERTGRELLGAADWRIVVSVCAFGLAPAAAMARDRDVAEAVRPMLAALAERWGMQ